MQADPHGCTQVKRTRHGNRSVRESDCCESNMKVGFSWGNAARNSAYCTAGSAATMLGTSTARSTEPIMHESCPPEQVERRCSERTNVRNGFTPWYSVRWPLFLPV